MDVDTAPCAQVRHILDNRHMKRYWLLFSQSVTVALAILFVVATLKPQWLATLPHTPGSLTLLEAPLTISAQRPAGSLSEAARIASPAVVSINTSKNAKPHRKDEPWFRFFNGEPDEQNQAGLGSGVIVSPQAIS